MKFTDFLIFLSSLIFFQNIDPTTAKKQLNLLASLLKGTENNKNEPTLKLNLFPDRKNAPSGQFSGDDPADDIIVIGEYNIIYLNFDVITFHLIFN